MVRHSYRQKQLQEALLAVHDYMEDHQLVILIRNTIQARIPGPRLSTAASQTTYLKVLQTLLNQLKDLDAQRYFQLRRRLPQHNDLILLLQEYEAMGHDYYRGFVRMKPVAFKDLTSRLARTAAFERNTTDKVCKQVAVAMYRLGRFGNGVSFRDTSVQCGCSVGSVYNWTMKTIDGLNELAKTVAVWASEEEKELSKRYVFKKVRVEEWTKGWAVVDGTHMKLAWQPGSKRNPREYFNWKGSYSLNVQLVMLPHSLRIIEYVVGFPGSAHDTRVWASGSKLVRKPRLYLDEGEFIWADGGYGYSPFTVGPYTASRADTVEDLGTFNKRQSRIRIRAEHGIAYLKQRFQVLKGQRSNVYRAKDEIKVSRMIVACIVAHTIASEHDDHHEIERLMAEDSTLRTSFRQHIVESNTQRPAPLFDSTLVQRRREAQREWEARTAQERIQRGHLGVESLRVKRAKQLRERMHKALYAQRQWPWIDTTAESRMNERAG